MRNYTLNTKETQGELSKLNVFTEGQVKLLLERGYKFDEFFQTYTKYVATFIDLKLDMNKKSLVFYCDKFFYPFELSKYVKDKESLYKINKEVKWLKENGFFIQKK